MDPTTISQLSISLDLSTTLLPLSQKITYLNPRSTHPQATSTLEVDTANEIVSRAQTMIRGRGGDKTEVKVKVVSGKLRWRSEATTACGNILYG